jgi:hypothetical protein
LLFREVTGRTRRRRCPSRLPHRDRLHHFWACTHQPAAWLQRPQKELVLDTLANWARTHNQAVVLLAGGLAATIFDPAAPPETDRGDDFATATDLMLVLALEGMERQSLKAYLRCRTENVVRRCWPAIQTTAALLQRGNLSGEELARVLLLARVPSAFSDEDRLWLPADPTEAAALILASDAHHPADQVLLGEGREQPSCQPAMPDYTQANLREWVRASSPRARRAGREGA